MRRVARALARAARAPLTAPPPPLHAAPPWLPPSAHGAPQAALCTSGVTKEQKTWLALHAAQRTRDARGRFMARDPAAKPPVYEAVAAAGGGAAGGASDSSGDDAPAAAPPRLVRAALSPARPAVDARTVAFLSAKGLGSPEEVEQMLYWRRSAAQRARANLFPFETASAVFAFLERISAGASAARHAGRLFPPAGRMVARSTNLLLHAPASLERKWAALLAPADDSAAASESSPDAAPRGGLGLSPLQARRVVTRHPNCLSYSTTWLLERRAWLLRLGIANPTATLAAYPHITGLSLQTLDDKCALLRGAGVDARAVVERFPTVLGLSRPHLQTKLSFWCHVMGLAPDTLARAPIFLGLNLQRRTRPRFLLLEQLAGVRAARGAAAAADVGAGGPPAPPGAPPRGPAALEFAGATATWLKHSEALFARRTLHFTPAAGWGVAGVRAHTAAPGFKAYADEREAELRAYHATLQQSAQAS